MRRRRWGVRRTLVGLLGVAVVLLALIQLVPYGRSHANPPITAEPRWDSPKTRQLVSDGCFSCHSNRTKWPWYSNVAPVSWLVQRDVNGGRGALNFSEWNRPQPALAEVVDQVLGGGMPPLQYRLIHPEARLSTPERRALAEGLGRTWAASPPAAMKSGGD